MLSLGWLRRGSLGEVQMMVWTDERMDDLATRVDAGFDRVDHDIRDLATRMEAGFERVDSEFRDVRAQMDLRFTRVDDEFRGVRAQMDTRFERVDSEIQSLRSDIRNFGIAVVIGLVGVIAALMGAIATGALAG
jgi:hypothetical protein